MALFYPHDREILGKKMGFICGNNMEQWEFESIYPSIIKRGNGKSPNSMEVYSWENHL